MNKTKCNRHTFVKYNDGLWCQHCNRHRNDIYFWSDLAFCLALAFLAALPVLIPAVGMHITATD